MLDAKKRQAEKRNLLSSFFITLLIGLAYAEMVPVVRESVRQYGFSPETLLLPAAFFFVSMRFFIGNQLHLLNDALLELPGLVWLYDLMVIITQSVVLVFLGGVVSVGANHKTSIGFLELLVALYMLDVVWILSQWLFGRCLIRWRRQVIPWPWAVLSSLLVVALIALDGAIDDLYSTKGQLGLLAINLLGFLVDVVLVDYYEALFDEEAPVPDRATMRRLLGEALAEAREGLAEGGIPIGSVLVLDGEIVGRGHNRRTQRASPILHAEMDCLENAGRLEPADYRRATLYTTLSPCDMCSGAVLLYKIPRVVIGENETFQGAEALLRSRGVELVVLDDPECIEMMRGFIEQNPRLWNEDIGVE